MIKHNKSRQIQSFWAYFSAIEANCADAISSGDGSRLERLTLEMHNELKFVDPGLCCQMGRDNEGNMELCITPDGQRQLFELALAMVSQAPELKRWKIIAFKPRIDIDDIDLRIGNLIISADTIQFHSSFSSMPIKLVLWFDVSDDVPIDALYQISNIFLDCSIGEYDAVTGIESLDVLRGKSLQGIPFVKFKDYFDNAQIKFNPRNA